MPASPLLAALLVLASSVVSAATETAASAPPLGISYDQLDEAVTKSGYVVARLEPVPAKGPREFRQVIKKGGRASTDVLAITTSSPQPSSSPDFVYLWFAPVNAAEHDSERSLDVITDVFRRVFPNWDDVAGWVMDASRDVWERWIRYPDGKPISIEDRILSVRRDDIWIDLYAMPPDLILYVVTTRAECRLAVTFIRRANPCLPDPSNP